MALDDILSEDNRIYEDDRIAQSILSEENRALEEINASRIANREVHLRFTHGEYCFTDGKTILVNPFYREYYRKQWVLLETEREMGLEPYFSKDEELAARLVLRMQVIRESLRVRYGDFSDRTATDANMHDAASKNLLDLIWEIIEDSYLDNVGCTLSKTIEQYLRFYRLMFKNANLEELRIRQEANFQDTDKELRQSKGQNSDGKSVQKLDSRNHQMILDLYLEYMAMLTFFPRLDVEPHPFIRDYVERTREYFALAGATSNVEKRYEYVKLIYPIIAELLTENPEGFTLDNGLTIEREKLDRIMGASRSHSEPDPTSRPNEEPEHPESTGRLFGDGAEDEPLTDGINRMSADLKASNPRYDVDENVIDAITLGCSEHHRGVYLRVLRPNRYDGSRDRYRLVYRKYRYMIGTYRARIDEYLHAEQETRVNRCYIGTDIDSRMLADPKHRRWYRRLTDQEMPFLSMIFMVDCSYSMSGERMQYVREAMIILHEVLKEQGMQYAIFGHSARQSKPLVEHKLVLDYDAKDYEKHQIYLLEPQDGSREGVSLLWANQYLKKHAVHKDRLIIVLSDGEPIHYAGYMNSFAPPESVDDARLCVRAIEKTGTKVIGIALDEGKSHCYDALSRIYSHTVENKDLKLLPKQLLELITQELRQRVRGM